MAPAIVHFLVGASLVLSLAALPIVRDRLPRQYLWFVAIGGLWGMGPDLGHVAPAFTAELSTFHGSRWADLFALHYTLDQPPIDTHPTESTAAAVALFLGTVVAVTVADAVGERDGHPRRVLRNAITTRLGSDASGPSAVSVPALVAVATVAVVAGVAVSGVLTATGHLESVAALIGGGSSRLGVVLALALGLVVSGTVAILVAIVDSR